MRLQNSKAPFAWAAQSGYATNPLTKRPRCIQRRPRMAMGNFSRRDIVRYAPLLVALSPLVAHSQANPSSPESSSNTADDAEAQLQKSDIDPRTDEPEITHKAYLDISIGEKPSHRVVIALYGKVAPKTVSNFLSLCEDGYADTKIYRIVPGLTVQLGDVLKNGGKSGRAATESGLLEAETFRVMHSLPGMVSMVTKNGAVDSRFFVTTRKGDSGYLDGKYVAFGRIVEGMELLDDIEKEGVGMRRKSVTIKDSGVIR